MIITTEKEVVTTIDPEGLEETTVKEKTRKIEKSREPDYIKIYTQMWCDFNQIPERWRSLFMELVTRMTYCDIGDGTGGQLVYTGKPYNTSICRSLGWQTDKKSGNLLKGLKALRDCNAIRKVSKGVYQINPEYAAKGEWKYNPQWARGGVEELVATFRMSAKEGMTSEVSVVFADDGQDTELNAIYREGLDVTAKDGTILTNRVSKPEQSGWIV